MAERSFTFQLDGDNVHPATMDVRRLLSVLERIAKAVETRARIEGIPLGENQPVLSLVGVRDKCLASDVQTPGHLAAITAEIVQDVQHRDLRRQPIPVQRELLALSDDLISQGLTLRMFAAGDPVPPDPHLGGVVRPIASAPRDLVRGETQFVGVVYLYNARQNSARMDVEGGSDRFVTIAGIDRDDMAFRKLIGHRLRVSGIATWDPNRAWEVVEFRLQSFEAADANNDEVLGRLASLSYETPEGELPSDIILRARRADR